MTIHGKILPGAGAGNVQVDELRLTVYELGIFNRQSFPSQITFLS